MDHSRRFDLVVCQLSPISYTNRIDQQMYQHFRLLSLNFCNVMNVRKLSNVLMVIFVREKRDEQGLLTQIKLVSAFRGLQEMPAQ